MTAFLLPSCLPLLFSVGARLLLERTLMTRDVTPTSERAAEQLREVARFMDANAESLVGDLDSVYVLDTGLRFSFVLEHGTIPTIEVTREVLVHERPKQ